MCQDGILYRLSKTGLTHSETEPITESMLGGGVWADELMLQLAQDRLRAVMGNDGGQVTLRDALDRVMTEWRDDFLPKLFNGEYQGEDVGLHVSPSVILRVTR